MKLKLKKGERYNFQDLAIVEVICLSDETYDLYDFEIIKIIDPLIIVIFIFLEWYSEGDIINKAHIGNLKRISE
ncbi:MAG: hypothetical protein P9X22_08895 [Candidatus Zapsychrus exili]|nr:hypothetical protein [Candidatus Zapsychrus exili]